MDQHSDLSACFVAQHDERAIRGDLHRHLATTGIAVPGPTIESLRLNDDRIQARQRLAAANVPISTAMTFTPGQTQPDRDSFLGWPCVVKSRLRSEPFDTRWLDEANALSTHTQTTTLPEQLLLERAVEGPLYSVLLFAGKSIGTAEIEVFRNPDGSMEHQEWQTPPALTRTQQSALERIAERASQALGLHAGWFARVDVIRSARHNERVVGIDALPPLGEGSFTDRILRAEGLMLSSFVGRAISSLRPGPLSSPFSRPLRM